MLNVIASQVPKVGRGFTLLNVTVKLCFWSYIQNVTSILFIHLHLIILAVQVSQVFLIVGWGEVVKVGQHILNF